MMNDEERSGADHEPRTMPTLAFSGKINSFGIAINPCSTVVIGTTATYLFIYPTRVLVRN